MKPTNSIRTISTHGLNCLIAALLLSGSFETLLFGATPDSAAPAAPLLQDGKMQWFREAKFGLFIHWGLYALPAGEWKGQPIPGIGEWIMNRAQIPVKDYEQLAPKFKPVRFNAEQWVQMAEDAGMKYIVITSKHHDGFAMYHSQVSKYNIYDATPFRRDPIKELAAACAKHSIKFGFYYSQAQDWHESNGAGNYGAVRSPFGDEFGEFSTKTKDRSGKLIFLARTDWRCTTKSGKLYFTLFKLPRDGFELPAFKNSIKKAYFLADPKREAIPIDTVEGARVAKMPRNGPNAIANVLCVEIEGDHVE
jgi:hypothetical protein